MSYEIKQPPGAEGAQRSFIWAAMAVFVLYVIAYIPGLIFNYMWMREAEKLKRTTGEAPPGYGCLITMFVVGLVMLAGMIGTLTMCAGMLATLKTSKSPPPTQSLPLLFKPSQSPPSSYQFKLPQPKPHPTRTPQPRPRFQPVPGKSYSLLRESRYSQSDSADPPRAGQIDTSSRLIVGTKLTFLGELRSSNGRDWYPIRGTVAGKTFTGWFDADQLRDEKLLLPLD